MDKKQYENGIHQISNDEYHASLGISRSGLMEFQRSPYHYWYKYLSGTYKQPEPTPALVFGNLLHTIVLEPEKFHDEFVIRPDCDRRTNAGKLLFNQFQSMLAGRISVTQEQVDLAHAMNAVVCENDLAKSLISQCAHIEKSIFFTHKDTGIQCKVRPDGFIGNCVIDLKSTQNGSYMAFQRSAVNYGYFLQAGMIHQALSSLDIPMIHFYFITVDKAEPYCIGIYALDAEAIDYGIMEFNLLMSRVKTCIDNNMWPQYGVQNLLVPKWAKFDAYIDSDGDDE